MKRYRDTVIDDYTDDASAIDWAGASRFLVGAVQCSHWPGLHARRRCPRPAEGWLLPPQGYQGAYAGAICQTCADLCATEYREKLNEVWRFTAGLGFMQPGGHHRERILEVGA